MGKQARQVPEEAQYVSKVIPGTKVKMLHRKVRHRLAPEKRPFIFPEDQVQDVAIALSLGMNIALTGPTGCITGEVKIGINRAGKGSQIRLDRLVRMHNGGKAGGHVWDSNIITMVRARMIDGSIRLVRLINAIESGVKPVFKVSFHTGQQVCSTADHRYWTINGWKQLRELQIGDEVYVENSRRLKKKGKKKKLSYKMRTVKLHPYVGRKGVRKGGYTVPLHRLVKEAALNGLVFEEFIRRCNRGPIEGLLFLDPEMLRVHHKNGKLNDNDLDNLEVLTDKAHKRQHRNLALANLAVKTVPARVAAISCEGNAMTYDLSLEEPHNFLANGVTVHNCGKTALPRAICAETGDPLIRFNCDGETRVSNLRGMNIPAAKDGVLTLAFSPGDLAVCMQEGYRVLLDEIDAALPSVRFVLQPVLEEDNRTLHIPETGETIVAQKGFAVFATGNTIGYRAVARAQHAGTTPINAAFLDRFGMVLACDYPSREDEFKRVKINVPNCDNDIVDGICRCAEELRADERFKSDFSTRRCIQWARLEAEYGIKGILHTSELAVVRKMEFAGDAKVAREVIGRIFGFEGD